MSEPTNAKPASRTGTAGPLSEHELDAVAGGYPWLDVVNPAGAVVQAVKTVYDVVQTVVGGGSEIYSRMKGR